MTWKVPTTLHTARLLLTLCTITFMLLVPVTATADESPAALVHTRADTGIDGEATHAALASFADAFMASDLFAAAAHFAQDAEILHSFDDGRVTRVQGHAAVNRWLSARAFVLPLRWINMRHPEAGAPEEATNAASPVVFTILQLSARYDDDSDSLQYVEAPLLLDADLAADGTIARLYVAYSVAGLSQTYTTPPTGALPAGPDYPHVARTAATAGSPADHSPPAYASLRVGPERGDYTWLTAALVASLAFAALRLRSGARPARSMP